MWDKMSRIYLCETEPNAFFKSMNVKESGRECCLALQRICWIEKMCSMQPLIPFRKHFCTEESRNLLAIAYF